MSNLPANIVDMAKNLQASVDSVSEGGDVFTFMKFAKGDWAFGQEEVEPERDSQWLVHPASFKHGWVAWGDEAHGNHMENLGEQIVPAVHPMPARDSLPAVQGTWAKTVSFQMKCLTGADAGLMVVFNTNSTGGRKLYSKILRAILARVSNGSEQIAPVLILSSSSYKHSKFGKIYNPEADIIDWLTLEELEQAGEGNNPTMTDVAKETQEALPLHKEAVEKVEEVKAQVTEAKEVKKAERTRRRSRTGKDASRDTENPDMTSAKPSAAVVPDDSKTRRVRRVRGN